MNIKTRKWVSQKYWEEYGIYPYPKEIYGYAKIKGWKTKKYKPRK